MTIINSFSLRRVKIIDTGESINYKDSSEIPNLLYELFKSNAWDYTKGMGNVILQDEPVSSILKVSAELTEKFLNEQELVGRYSARVGVIPGRKSFSIEFRSPLILNDDGTPGRKVRKGAGSDKKLADELCKEVNFLLSNPIYWNISGFKLSEDKVSTRAREIFYTGTTLMNRTPTSLFK